MFFQSLFNPRGVVVSGSVAPGKLGARIINRLIDGGMENIYALNPKAQGLGSAAGFSSAQDIKKPLDLLIAVSPAPHVAAVLEDCGRAGVKAAVIISSGFGEAGHEDLEQELKATALKYNIRYTGPNCAGIINTHGHLFATIEAIPPKGKTALLSQSGAVGGSIMAAAEENGLGISKFISYGNSADLTELEFLRYLKDDDETAVIAVYVENIKNGRAFMKVLREVSAKKPVVIIKSGRTSIGQRAALSHTGALAGADSVYDAAFKECGALRVESIDEMFNLCKALADLPLPGGNNVLIVTNSGGPGVMTADKGELCGLSLKEPSDAVKAELKGFLPDFASLRNPIDLTVEGTGEQYSKALATGLQDFDAAIAIYVGTPYLKALPVAEGIISAYRAANKPVLSFLQVGEDITESVNTLKYASLPVYSSGEKAAQVLARMAEYRHYLMKKPVEKEEITACGSLPGTDKMLFEADAAALLEKNGIHIPPWRFVNKRENVAEACGEIGFPLCVKIVSPQIIHKSDSGGVVLGISSAAEALNAFDSMEKAAAGLDFKGVMLYPMLKGGVEVILGISRDAQFGPVILFGLGGVYSEVFKDVALRIAPVSEEEAAEMIAGTRAYNILKGIRGRKGADLKSLAIMISRLSRLPFYYPEIAEIDLNPVFADEHGCVAADMRIIRK